MHLIKKLFVCLQGTNKIYSYMEKLELKHLAGYLPYGLKGIESVGLPIHVLHSLDINKKAVWRNHEFPAITSRIDCKPILRPLSDLTKEIEVNREKFVPIEVLLDIESGCNWSCSDYLVSESGVNEWWTRLQLKPSYVFGFNKNGFYMLNKFSEAKTAFNQNELWQKLYEWHFDIYGLIEKGLAIDINTLNK